jgi:hypothetical protein
MYDIHEEMNDRNAIRDGRDERRSAFARRAYLVVLWLLVVALFAGIVGCASGTKEKAQGGAVGDPTSATGRPLRLLLVETAAQDSVPIVRDFHVDQVLRQVFDSVDGVDYLTLNVRDSITLAKDPTGKKGVPLPELATALDLDGVINVALARFGSVLAAELRIVDAKSGAVRFRDVVFQLIRYRDSAGTMLVGPALYDALRTNVGRFVGRKHEKGSVVASTPIVLSAVVIPSDPRLRNISSMREGTSRSVLTALHDYAGTHFPELVTFDPMSRDRLYTTIRVAGVPNYQPPKDAERQALFNVGVDRFLVGAIDPVGADSLRMRLEVRTVVDRAHDSLEFSREMVQPVALFSSSAFEEDVIVAMLDLAEPLFGQVADTVRARYERARIARVETGAERTR